MTDTEAPGTDLVEPSAAELELADKIKARATGQTVIPRIKLTNALTREVEDGRVESGHFLNTLTLEDLGDKVQVIVADHFDGRFWSDDDNKGHRATGDVIPWDDHPDYGKHFADSPDAEETYRAAVDDGEHEWGKGPPISTTKNFYVLVVGEQASALPAEISFMRTSAPAGRKLNTLVNSASRAPWDNIYTLRAVRAESGGRAYYKQDIELSRKATPEERSLAVELALAIEAGKANVVGDEDAADDEAPEKPTIAPREGALDV